LASQAEKFKAEYGIDPSPLIHRDHMSDEMSGPEDVAEGHDAWRARMAEALGLRSDVAEKIDFFEVPVCEWRSERVRFSPFKSVLA
jgi:hypothetical protein